MAKLDIIDESRYSRQKLLPYWDQDKLANSKAIIGGVGALGTVIATNLAMMGVGEIILIDMDTIEISNLSRQLLFKKEHTGQYKADVAAKELKRINHEIKVIPFKGRVQESLESFYETKNYESAVIIEGFDNFDARRWVNSRSIYSDIPLVSGGIYGMLGNVQVVIPRKTACLDCQPLIPEKQLQKACTLPGQKRQQNTEEEFVPAVASVATVISGIMTQEALKIMLDKRNYLMTDYLFWDGMSQSFIKIPLTRRDDCVSCSEKYKLKGVTFYATADETFKQFYDRIKITFMAKKPEIMISAKTIPLTEKNSRKKVKDVLKNKKTIFVTDQELAAPLKLNIKLKTN